MSSIDTLLDRLVPPARVRAWFEFGGRHAWTLLGVGLLVGAVVPFIIGDGFYLSVAGEMLMFAVLALSWDIVGGQTGYPSFGQMAFFGIGGYVTAIMFRDFGVFWPGLVLAGVLSLVAAAVIGAVVLRLRGGYFAIATLGILLTLTEVTRNISVTNGVDGISFLSTLPATTFYYVFLGLLGVEAGLLYYLSQTRFGYTLNAIRDDEAKVNAMGVNTTYYKVTAWMLAALFTGMAGGAWSLFNFFVDPLTAYNTAWNVELIAMALLGGTGTIVGPILGGMGLHAVIRLFVETYFTGWQLGLLGLIIIVTIIVVPSGVVGWLGERASAMDYYEHGGGAAGEESGGETGGEPE